MIRTTSIFLRGLAGAFFVVSPTSTAATNSTAILNTGTMSSLMTAASTTCANIPVAVFVGGTSGIGQGMVETFARHTGGNARIVIVGRNKAAAEEIISRFPTSTTTLPASSYEFVQCDLTLMKNVQEVTTSLLQKLPKINYLVITAGFMTMSGRTETNEGIDRKLAVHYYARWKLIKDLLPALSRAQEDGEDAKVMSLLGAGAGGAIDENDLGLKKVYSVTRAALQAPTYNDLMLEVKNRPIFCPSRALTHPN